MIIENKHCLLDDINFSFFAEVLYFKSECDIITIDLLWPSIGLAILGKRKQKLL